MHAGKFVFRGAPRVSCRRSIVTKASMFDPDVPPPNVGRIVICGGGIMGAATAHYLAEMGVARSVTVIERESVACAASGKAGGFLALDWNDTSPVRSLARKSYALHAELADTFGSEIIGYRQVTTLTVAGVESAGKPVAPAPGSQLLPTWVDGNDGRRGNIIAAASMGSKQTTAQVHPYKLTNAFMGNATSKGTRLVKATVKGLQLEETSGGKKVTGVLVEGGPEAVVPADVVVIAMGPWSDEAASRWGLPLPRITGQKYHSILIQPQYDQTRPKPPVSAEMLFTNFAYASGREVEPEVYPRPDGTIYVCGEPQALPVPPSPAEVSVEEGLCDNIFRVAASLSSRLAESPIVAKQACYLPMGPDGVPIIGPVPGFEGVHVATGHTCWGILNAPATGKALAELIVEGKATTVDLKPFSPARFLVTARR